MVCCDHMNHMTIPFEGPKEPKNVGKWGEMMGNEQKQVSFFVLGEMIFILSLDKKTI